MNKLSNFIVEKRKIILVVFLALAVACVFLMGLVNVNYDMTDYLPDDSSTKAGLAVMNSEFEARTTITVMMGGLLAEEKLDICDQLAALPNVDGVTYDETDQLYNRDGYTLYVVNVLGDSYTKEAAGVLKTLKSTFDGREIYFSGPVVDSESTNMDTVILLAMVMLMVILFAMCASWLEPVLFLVAIAIAIVMNMGTNCLFPSVSSMTHSIAAILQLALSMDYSIMLIDRYRQEKVLSPDDNKTAMKRALTGGFLAIGSSSVTTIAGLLCLVFMSFTIGMDMGLVLAKGVFFSLVCIFFMLPALILLFDKQIEKTKKPVLRFKMKGVAAFGYKFRYGILALFVVLFVGSFLMKGNTKIEFYTSSANPDQEVIEAVFSPSNSLVVLYENEDEAKLESVAEQLSKENGVKSVTSYSNTLGKEYTSRGLAREVEMDASLLNMLYYDYYTGGTTGDIPLESFISFIIDDVAPNEEFDEYFGSETLDELDTLSVFANSDEVQRPMASQEMAELLNMSAQDLKDLYLYNFIENSQVNGGSMELATFVDFVLGDVADDEQFGDALGKAQLEQMETLSLFAHPDTATRPMSAKQLAGALDMDAQTMDLLLSYYYGNKSASDPGGMTLPAFVAFLKDDVASNARFSGFLQGDMAGQLDTLATFTDATSIKRKYSGGELASLLGMDADTLDMLFYVYFKDSELPARTMTMPAFVNFIADDVAKKPAFAGYFDQAALDQIKTMQGVLNAAESGKSYTSAQLSAFTGMDSKLIDQLFIYATLNSASPAPTLTLSQFTDFILSDMAKNSAFSGYFDQEALARLTFLRQLSQGAESKESYTSAQLSGLTGMKASDIDAVFAGLSRSKGSQVAALPLAEFVDLLVTNPAFSSSLSPAERAQLSSMQGLIAACGQSLTSGRMAILLGMDRELVKKAYILYNADMVTTMTLPAFIDFLLGAAQHPEFSAGFDREALTNLGTMKGLMDIALSGASYDSAQMGGLVGMDGALVDQLYFLYQAKYDSTSNLKIPLYDFVDFLIEDVSANERYSAYFDSAAVAQLTYLRQVMDVSLAGDALTCDQMASLMTMDASTVRTLYFYHTRLKGDTGDWKISLKSMVDFLAGDLAADANFASLVDKDAAEGLKLMQTVASGGIAGKKYTSTELADLMDMSPKDARQLYLFYTSEYGDTSSWSLSVQEFVDFVLADVATDEELSEYLDADMLDQLDTAKTMIDSVVAGTSYSASALLELIGPEMAELDQETMELMYLYYFSQQNSDPAWKLSLYDFFDYIVDEIVPDERFSAYFDDESLQELEDAKEELHTGKGSLVGPEHSLLIMETSFARESDEVFGLIEDVSLKLDGTLGEYTILGDSATAYEMQASFSDEVNTITILTAVTIFIVVAVTFRSFIIPALLVLIIQCAVFITMGLAYVQGIGIYYLAVLIVQALLMGATIDYAILYTEYYRENRRMHDIPQSLINAYSGSMMTILTSSSILCLVTLVVGLVMDDATTSQVCLTISKGSFVAAVLVIFILPGMLAVFDRFVCQKKDKKREQVFRE